jgi:hypothetical protein
MLKKVILILALLLTFSTSTFMKNSIEGKEESFECEYGTILENIIKTNDDIKKSIYSSDMGEHKLLHAFIKRIGRMAASDPSEKEITDLINEFKQIKTHLIINELYNKKFLKVRDHFLIYKEEDHKVYLKNLFALNYFLFLLPERQNSSCLTVKEYMTYYINDIFNKKQ